MYLGVLNVEGMKIGNNNKIYLNLVRVTVRVSIEKSIKGPPRKQYKWLLGTPAENTHTNTNKCNAHACDVRVVTTAATQLESQASGSQI